MMALKAGAKHVTAVERWLYLSLACNDPSPANGFTLDQFLVLYKRPTDLRLLTDVPVCCNLLICDILDEGAPLHVVAVHVHISFHYLYSLHLC